MNTLRRIVFLITLSSILNGYGQDNLKIRTASSGDIIAYGTFSGILDFGNGTIVGEVTSEDEGYFLASFDSARNLRWVKHLKGESQRCSGICPGIGLSVDLYNNILITGNYWNEISFDSIHTLSNSGRAESFIAKYDDEGNFLWMLHGSSPGLSKGVEIDTDSKGNVYASGYFSGEGPFTLNSIFSLPAQGSVESVYISRISSSGNVDWLGRIHGPGPDNHAGVHIQSHATDSSGNSYLTGYYGGSEGVHISFGEHVLTYHGEDMEIFVAKCSPDGEPLWLTNAPSASGYDMPDQIAVDNDGNLFITGMIQETVQFGTLPILHPNYHRDVFIAKYDTSGQANWVQIGLPIPGFVNAVGRGITVNNTGDIFSVGSFTDSLLFPPLPIITSDTGHGFLVKHDSLGVALHATNYALDFQDIHFGLDKCLYTISGDPSVGIHESEVTITKWDQDCNRIWDRVIQSNIYIGIEETRNSPKFAIYPNPTAGMVTIETDIEGVFTINIVSLRGQLLYSWSTTTSSCEIDLSPFEKGIYFITVNSPGFVTTKKVIKL